MSTVNSLISPSLGDKTEQDSSGKTVYSHDCHNSPICQSYGTCFVACLAGSYAGTRCSHGEKMQIRILNDMNPNAIYKPSKPSKAEINDYLKG